MSFEFLQCSSNQVFQVYSFALLVLNNKQLILSYGVFLKYAGSRVTKVDIANHTSVNNIVREVMRRWRWLGHVLCMSRRRLPQVALKWTPIEKRLRGRPPGTWRRTVEERTLTGKTWHELRWLAQDYTGWRRFIDALWSSRREGD